MCCLHPALDRTAYDGMLRNVLHAECYINKSNLIKLVPRIIKLERRTVPPLCVSGRGSTGVHYSQPAEVKMVRAGRQVERQEGQSQTETGGRTGHSHQRTGQHIDTVTREQRHHGDIFLRGHGNHSDTVTRGTLVILTREQGHLSDSDQRTGVP